MSEFLTAVELSTSKVSVAVGTRTQSGVKVVSHHTFPVEKGFVSRGDVFNTQRVAEALSNCIKEAQRDINDDITDVILCLSSPFVTTESYKLEKKRTNADADITEAELKQYIKEVKNSAASAGEKVFEVIPASFNIDDCIGVKDVEGMRGESLEGFYNIVKGKESSEKRKREVVEMCGLNVIWTVLSGIGSAKAALNETETENGVVLLDIGAGITDVIIVRDDIVRKVGVIPFGGDTITSDIKNVCCITTEMSEVIKCRFGSCTEEGIPENKKLVIKGMGGSEEKDVMLVALSRIIEARVSEIFDAAMYLVENWKYENKIPAGFVITGGSCYLENIRPLCRAITGHKTRIASSIGSITDDSVESCFDTQATSIVGALMTGFDNEKEIRAILDEMALKQVSESGKKGKGKNKKKEKNEKKEEEISTVSVSKVKDVEEEKKESPVEVKKEEKKGLFSFLKKKDKKENEDPDLIDKEELEENKPKESKEKVKTPKEEEPTKERSLFDNIFEGKLNNDKA